MKHRSERKPMKEIRFQMTALGATRGQLKQLEVSELPKILYEKEEIKAFIIGFYDGGYGMMVATDLRLIFVDVMVFGRVKMDDIPYSMLGSTELQLGMLFATMTVFTRSQTYRFWWLKKDNASDFNEYLELQMLKQQKESTDNR